MSIGARGVVTRGEAYKIHGRVGVSIVSLLMFVIVVAEAVLLRR